MPVAMLVVRAFEQLGISYLIGGSIASTLYGEPRSTLDADFAVHLERADVEPLIARLEPDFFVDASSVREAAERKAHFNVIHRGVFVKVDVHVRPRSGHFAEEIRRAREIRLPDGGLARIATPEDTLLRKLWWYRLGDGASDRQWRDALGILRAIGPTLDREYLVRWAADLEVADLVQRAWRDAGLGQGP